MKELRCKECCSTDIEIDGNIAICKYCGTSYLLSNKDNKRLINIPREKYKNERLRSLTILLKQDQSHWEVPVSIIVFLLIILLLIFFISYVIPNS